MQQYLLQSLLYSGSLLPTHWTITILPGASKNVRVNFLVPSEIVTFKLKVLNNRGQSLKTSQAVTVDPICGGPDGDGQTPGFQAPVAMAAVLGVGAVVALRKRE